MTSVPPSPPSLPAAGFSTEALAWVEAMREQARSLTERFQRERSEVLSSHDYRVWPEPRPTQALDDGLIAFDPRVVAVVNAAFEEPGEQRSADELAELRDSGRQVLSAFVQHTVAAGRGGLSEQIGSAPSSADEYLDDGITALWTRYHLSAALRGSDFDQVAPGVLQAPDRRGRDRSQAAARSFTLRLADVTGQLCDDQLTALAQQGRGQRFGYVARQIYVARGLTSVVSEHRRARTEDWLAQGLRSGMDEAAKVPGPGSWLKLVQAKSIAKHTVADTVHSADLIKQQLIHAGVVPLRSVTRSGAGNAADGARKGQRSMRSPGGTLSR